MIQVEFDRWWADLTMRFPSVDAWLVRVAPDSIGQRAMLRSWFGAMNDVALANAMEINQKMQAGDLPWVGEYDSEKEKLPQHVRRLAKQLSWERRERPADDPKDLKPTSFPAGKILRRICELRDKGATPEDAKAIALKELPVGRPTYQPRFRCLICLDAGMVTVASQTALNYLLADKFHECHHREAAMRCSCKGHLPANPNRPTVIYDPDQNFKIEDYLWREDEVQRFRAWAEMKREDYWNSKRDESFDRFNQREFAP